MIVIPFENCSDSKFRDQLATRDNHRRTDVFAR
jgi:hypothetical protein